MQYKDDFCCGSYTPAHWCREKRDILERNNEDLSLQIRSEVTERLVLKKQLRIEIKGRLQSSTSHLKNGGVYVDCDIH
jgi:hypothetical protein